MSKSGSSPTIHPVYVDSYPPNIHKSIKVYEINLISLSVEVYFGYVYLLTMSLVLGGFRCWGFSKVLQTPSEILKDRRSNKRTSTKRGRARLTATQGTRVYVAVYHILLILV